MEKEQSKLLRTPQKHCRNWTFTRSFLSLQQEFVSNFPVSLQKWWRGGLGFEFQVKIEDMDTGKFRCSGDFRISSLLVVFLSCLSFLPPAAHWDFQSPVTIFPRVFSASALDTPLHSPTRCHIFLGMERKPFGKAELGNLWLLLSNKWKIQR